jgi:hypothetical protein
MPIPLPVSARKLLTSLCCAAHSKFQASKRFLRSTVDPRDDSDLLGFPFRANNVHLDKHPIRVIASRHIASRFAVAIAFDILRGRPSRGRIASDLACPAILLARAAIC